MMSDAVLNAIILASGTIVVTILARVFGRKDTSYSQIQKDLAGQRNHSLNQDNLIAWLNDVITIYDDENGEMRQAMREAGLPVPPRHPRPPRPELIRLEIPE